MYNSQYLGDDANECTPGHYCIEGTASPIPCPKGTFSNEYGLQKEDDCEYCTPGEYCGEVGQTNTSGLCYPGWVIMTIYKDTVLWPHMWPILLKWDSSVHMVKI